MNYAYVLMIHEPTTLKSFFERKSFYIGSIQSNIFHEITGDQYCIIHE